MKGKATIGQCTPDNPYNESRTEDRFQHKDAHEVGEQEDGYPGGDIVTMECPHCNLTWKMELPQ